MGQKGIDDLLKVDRPDVDYVVVEYKFGSSKLSSTNDGLQMADDWLLGTNTGTDRILQSVGSQAAADDVKLALQANRVEKWIVHTDPFGKVTVGIVGSDGKLIVKQSSMLIGAFK